MRHLRVRRRRSSAGFTVLELMVATSIFAIVLLVLTAGVLSFSRDYFASITRSNTQAVARSIIDDVARSVQFAQSAPTSPVVSGKTSAVCIDNIMYSYAIGQQVSDNTSIPKHQSLYGMVKTVPPTSCSVPADITSSSYGFDKDIDHELLGKNMRLSALSISSDGDNTYTIRVRVAYGEDDLLGINGANPADWSSVQCKNGTGSQFCAVSDLTTTIQQRITN